MAKVILICGKIASGKTFYAKKLVDDLKAVLLSCDEITLALFSNNIGEKHDYYVEKVQKYLFNKSLELIHQGINVVLDWGFWTKIEREEAKAFYKNNNVEVELHYIEVNKEKWLNNLNKRNQNVKMGLEDAYYIELEVANKFSDIFEEPNNEEDIHLVV